MAYMKEAYREIKQIIRGTVDGTADTITGLAGHDFDVVCLTGNLWANPLITAAAATAIPLTIGQAVGFCLKAGGTLSLISDVTTATYLIIVWGE